MSNCLNKIINIFLSKTINENYWLVIAAGMLRSISKKKYISSPMYIMGADVIANLMARACLRHVKSVHIVVVLVVLMFWQTDAFR